MKDLFYDFVEGAALFVGGALLIALMILLRAAPFVVGVLLVLWFLGLV